MSLTDSELARSHRLALGSFAFGSLATLLINIAHAQDGMGAKLTSVIAPISVLLVVEMFLHAPKPDSRKVATLMFGVIGVIGAAALTISYAHTAQLLLSYGETALLAWLMPLIPDGMMVISSMVLALVMREKEKRSAEKAEAAQVALRKAEAAEKRRVAKESRPKASKVETKAPTEAAAPAKKVSAKELQLEAQELFRKSQISGQPLTAAELAAKFDRKEPWARQQMRAVLDSPQLVAA